MSERDGAPVPETAISQGEHDGHPHDRQTLLRRHHVRARRAVAQPAPRANAAQLYGVGPLDPAVMIGAVAVLAATSFVACLGLARRAARISPVVVLSQP